MTNYERISHTHCFNQSNPPCGKKAHAQCCLCDAMLAKEKYKQYPKGDYCPYCKEDNISFEHSHPSTVSNEKCAETCKMGGFTDNLGKTELVQWCACGRRNGLQIPTQSEKPKVELVEEKLSACHMNKISTHIDMNGNMTRTCAVCDKPCFVTVQMIANGAKVKLPQTPPVQAQEEWEKEVQSLLYELAEPADLAHRGVGGRILSLIKQTITQARLAERKLIAEEVKGMKKPTNDKLNDLKANPSDWNITRTGYNTAISEVLNLLAPKDN